MQEVLLTAVIMGCCVARTLSRNPNQKWAMGVPIKAE
jgi:hypothetical protein